jgi:pimeloyl-ACP methyl ester carboxylesterase
MYKYFFAITLIISLNCKAQTIIEGNVKSIDNVMVSYCSIGIKDTKLGTITDENGKYKFEIPYNLNNKEIVFSSVGYNDKIISIADLKVFNNIILEYKTTNLNEVVISSNKMKEKVIGQKTRPFLTFSKMFDKNVPTIEQGSFFPVYQRTRLKSYNYHIIPSSKFKQITLKLNIYSVKNNVPDKSLLDENIIYKTSSTGWQNIDLSKYKLVFNHLDMIAVTLQLVDYEPLENSEFIFGVSAKKTLSKNLLFRYQSQGIWELNAGGFISNLEIGYTKNKDEKDIIEEDINIEDNSKTKTLIEVYKNREKALKTNYGKNKDGKYIDLENAKIYYEEYGKGHPLLLLHGNGGSISDFYQQIPFLSKHYRVIAIDTRGQGKSTDLTTEDYTYEEFAHDLYKVIQYLNLEKMSIIGWSDGGNTGFIFNSEHPELVGKLITIGANLNPSGVSENILNDLKKQISENEAGNQRLIKLMLNQPDITSKQLSHINNSVLIIAGSDDVIKEEHTKEIHKLIQDSELEIIQNATHYAPFEQPKKLNELLLEFLRK